MPRVWLPLLLLLLLVGCGPQEVHIGGRPMRVPRRVVSLSPGTTELIVSSGQPQQLAGKTAACNFPAYVKQANIPIYANVKPDYEKLANDKPDLIVLDRTLYSDADMAKLEELKLPMVVFHATTLDEFIEQLKVLGDSLGSAVTTSNYVDKITAEREVAKSSAPNPAPKAAALTAGLGYSHLIAGDKSFVADIMRNSGAEPVGPDADRFVDLNPETLVSLNPDVVFLAVTFDEKDTAPATQAVTAFLADPRFKSIKAVANKRVYPVSADVMLRQGSRVDRLIKGLSTALKASS